MEKIYLSDSGPKVSPAVYGFWRWDSPEQKNLPFLEKIVNLCLQSGINTFDHADIYGGYEMEELFGQLLKLKSFRREDIVLFTKCGVLLPHHNRPDIRVPYIDTSAKHIQWSVERSLKNFGTDYIDIFLLDSLDPLSNLEETALVLERLRTAGKIRNIGISNFSVYQHQLLASYLRVPIVTNHIELNLLNTTALDNGQIDYIKQRYMRPLAASPLAGGRIENGNDLAAIQLRTKLEEHAKRYDANVESLAVAWIIKLGALPLIGTFNENRIRNIVKAFDLNLSQQDWYDLYYTGKSFRQVS